MPGAVVHALQTGIGRSIELSFVHTTTPRQPRKAFDAQNSIFDIREGDPSRIEVIRGHWTAMLKVIESSGPAEI